MTVIVVVKNTSNHQAVLISIVQGRPGGGNPVYVSQQAIVEPGLELLVGCGPDAHLAIDAHDPLAIVADRPRTPRTEPA